MPRFNVEYVLNKKIRNPLSQPIPNNITIQDYKFNSNLSSAIITIESDTPSNATEVARKTLEIFLDLYFLYSLDAAAINESSQIEVHEPDKKEGGHISQRVTAEPHDPFNSDTFNQILATYNVRIANQNSNYLHIAMEYYRRGRLEHYNGTKIIDIFVSLEALYSKNEEKTEMRYRFSNRVATLLGKDVDDRKKLFKDLRDMYDLRSAIVHGSTNEINMTIWGSLFKWTRESILRFLALSMNYSHDEIIDNIDLGMIDNSVRDDLRTKSTNLLDKVRDLHL